MRSLNSLASGRRGRAVLGTIGVAVTLGLWLVLSNTSKNFYFPPLQDILVETVTYWTSPDGVRNLVASLTNLFAGLAIATVVGSVLGIALGQLRVVERALSPSLEFVRAIPATALIPFAMMLFGIGVEMKVFLIALGCVWPILLNAIDGARRLDPTLLDTAKSFRITGIRRQLSFVVPAVAPRIAGGMRVAIPLSLILMVTSEMVGSNEGIGFVITSAQATFRLLTMWSGIVLLGVLGFVLAVLFDWAERRLLAWTPAHRPGRR